MGRRRYTEQQFRDAVADPTVTTIADLCRRLGIVPSGGNYASLQTFAMQLDVGTDLFSGRRAGHRRRRPPDLSDRTAVARIVAEARSLAEAITGLGGEPTTYSRIKLRAFIDEHELLAPKMRGQGWARGRTRPSRVPITELFERSTVSSSFLRRRLIVDGYKEHRCEECGRTRWENQPIPLELDHIDGDRTNNRLENLRLLCPNCHALTPTYRGRNIGRH